MAWLLRKLDTLAGAVVAGTGGAATSQLQAFIGQYLQRLGGHVDEAQRTYDTILQGERYRQMTASARELIAQDALARVNDLQGARDAIDGAGLFAKPFVFAAHIDWSIARGTWESFTPAVPVDMAGLIYSAMGLLVGLIAYEIVKAPFGLMGRRDKPRPARR